MIKQGRVMQAILLAAIGMTWTLEAFAYRANRVHFHTLQNGIFRVTVEYTVPELKQFREAYVEFRNFAKARDFYWDAVRGVDFFWKEPEGRKFIQNPKTPDPW